MSDVVRHASRDEQLALIRAHPDLVGRLARENKLTRESTGEQAAAGLTTLTLRSPPLSSGTTPPTVNASLSFRHLRAQNKKDAIVAAFPLRLTTHWIRRSRRRSREIDKIAELRLRDAIWE